MQVQWSYHNYYLSNPQFRIFSTFQIAFVGSCIVVFSENCLHNSYFAECVYYIEFLMVPELYELCTPLQLGFVLLFLKYYKFEHFYDAHCWINLLQIVWNNLKSAKNFKTQVQKFGKSKLFVKSKLFYLTNSFSKSKKTQVRVLQQLQNWIWETFGVIINSQKNLLGSTPLPLFFLGLTVNFSQSPKLTHNQRLSLLFCNIINNVGIVDDTFAFYAYRLAGVLSTACIGIWGGGIF
eukprot:TRINITY_DN29997_c0_g3_i2.p1 TRINITY_DN29997_c0_g3~~TRINITY_DN29997_c0_g3_i2.p1  ORF type:complete len:236 (+),score=-0.41 TRINITY_DN29997_c0_g3_i2:217-924(+)